MKLSNPETAAAKIRKRSRLRPTLAVVLGSGFHSAADALDVDSEVVVHHQSCGRTKQANSFAHRRAGVCGKGQGPFGTTAFNFCESSCRKDSD